MAAKKQPIKKPAKPAPKGRPELTAKQRMFVAEYLIDKNATQACIRAGYSKKTAASIGDENLRKPAIKAAIDAELARLLEKLQISTERTMFQRAAGAYYDIGDLAKANIRNVEDIATLPDHVRQAVTGWKWDKDGNLVLQFADKAQHLTAIEKHLGLYKADNEQNNPPPPEIDPKGDDMIRAARAITFVLMRGAMQAKKKKPATA